MKTLQKKKCDENTAEKKSGTRQGPGAGTHLRLKQRRLQEFTVQRTAPSQKRSAVLVFLWWIWVRNNVLDVKIVLTLRAGRCNNFYSREGQQMKLLKSEC